MILVIVESPGKTGKIQSILGPDYVVKSSVGHVMDLAVDNLSIDIIDQEKGWTFLPKLQIKPDSRNITSSLQALGKKASQVVIATDKDREGEAIGENLAHVLKLKNPPRISFDEITESAIKRAIDNPGVIDQNLVKAQQTRRVLDRIVGYKVSPLLAKGLSAGRVQSVVVRLIRDNDRAVQEALDNLQSHYKVKGLFHPKLEAKYEPNLRNDNIESNLQYLMSVRKTYYISEIKNFKSERAPPKPFITSSLQQEASLKLRMNIATTMRVAQKLYEQGFITYMRTDSVNLSKDIYNQCKGYISKNYGLEYFKARVYKNKGSSQEAHECIRPTNLNKSDANLGPQEQKLYQLIWTRTIACLMANAKYDCQEINILNHDQKWPSNAKFMSSAKKLTFDGYLRVYRDGELENDESTILGEGFTENQTMELKSLDGTQEYKFNASHFTEASLVKKLESLEIGRPSTFASIIKIIQDRGYVTMCNPLGVTKEIMVYKVTPQKISSKEKNITIGAAKSRLLVTEIGIEITEWMEKHFMNLMDYKFTANMERKLDEIAEGKVNWQTALNEFYLEFHPCLRSAEIACKTTNKTTNTSSNKKELGSDDSGKLYLVKTRYGFSIMKEWTKFKANKKPLVTFCSAPNEDPTLEQAQQAYQEYQVLGVKRNQPVLLINGKFGWYVRYGKTNVSVKTNQITFEKAQELLKL